MTRRRNRTGRRRDGRIRLGRREQRILALQLGLLLCTLVVISRCVVPGRTPGGTGSRGGRPVAEQPYGEARRGSGEFYFGHAFFPERPRVETEEFLFHQPHGRYSYYYDTLHRQSAWVAYMLTSSDLTATTARRSDRFRPDPAIREKGWPHPADRDYVRSGWDRGHLLPSADRLGSKEENEATFLFSNVSPQSPALNRRVWKSLEEEIRRYASRYDTLLIVTGGICTHEGERIGGSGITVPGSFFKAVFARKEGGYISAGFLIPNAASVPGGCWDYSLPVRELEQLLGMEFFYTLPDSLKEVAFGMNDPGVWKE